jgi:hypothetical protein
MYGTGVRRGWDVDGGSFVDLDWQLLPGALRDAETGYRHSHRSHATDHEIRRRQFANGPKASQAARMLEQALGIRSANCVATEFAARTLRSVKHHFDSPGVAS